MSKKQPKLTPWFPPDVKPAHVGSYQTEDDPSVLGHFNHGYQWWDGKAWGLFELTHHAAATSGHTRSSFQDNYWRGLAVKP